MPEINNNQIKETSQYTSEKNVGFCPTLESSPMVYGINFETMNKSIMSNKTFINTSVVNGYGTWMTTIKGQLYGAYGTQALTEDQGANLTGYNGRWISYFNTQASTTWTRSNDAQQAIGLSGTIRVGSKEAKVEVNLDKMTKKAVDTIISGDMSAREMSFAVAGQYAYLSQATLQNAALQGKASYVDVKGQFGLTPPLMPYVKFLVEKYAVEQLDILLNGSVVESPDGPWVTEITNKVEESVVFSPMFENRRSVAYILSTTLERFAQFNTRYDTLPPTLNTFFATFGTAANIIPVDSRVMNISDPVFMRAWTYCWVATSKKRTVQALVSRMRNANNDETAEEIYVPSAAQVQFTLQNISKIIRIENVDQIVCPFLYVDVNPSGALFNDGINLLNKDTATAIYLPGAGQGNAFYTDAFDAMDTNVLFLAFANLLGRASLMDWGLVIAQLLVRYNVQTHLGYLTPRNVGLPFGYGVGNSDLNYATIREVNSPFFLRPNLNASLTAPPLTAGAFVMNIPNCTPLEAVMFLQQTTHMDYYYVGWTRSALYNVIDLGSSFLCGMSAYHMMANMLLEQQEFLNGAMPAMSKTREEVARVKYCTFYYGYDLKSNLPLEQIKHSYNLGATFADFGLDLPRTQVVKRLYNSTELLNVCCFLQYKHGIELMKFKKVDVVNVTTVDNLGGLNLKFKAKFSDADHYQVMFRDKIAQPRSPLNQNVYILKGTQFPCGVGASKSYFYFTKIRSTTYANWGIKFVTGRLERVDLSLAYLTTPFRDPEEVFISSTQQGSYPEDDDNDILTEAEISNTMSLIFRAKVE